MPIKAAEIKKLRQETGAGVMDCQKALQESGGDWDKALAWIKQKGLANAEKKADRQTSEGYVGSYVHSNGKLAALVELQCETDFVARGEEFRQLAGEISMQVAAMAPASAEDLLAEELVKRPGTTVAIAIKELSGKIGEKMQLGKFVRLQVGD